MPAGYRHVRERGRGNRGAPAGYVQVLDRAQAGQCGRARGVEGMCIQRTADLEVEEASGADVNGRTDRQSSGPGDFQLAGRRLADDDLEGVPGGTVDGGGMRRVIEVDRGLRARIGHTGSAFLVPVARGGPEAVAAVGVGPDRIAQAVDTGDVDSLSAGVVYELHGAEVPGRHGRIGGVDSDLSQQAADRETAAVTAIVGEDVVFRSQLHDPAEGRDFQRP